MHPTYLGLLVSWFAVAGALAIAAHDCLRTRRDSWLDLCDESDDTPEPEETVVLRR